MTPIATDRLVHWLGHHRAAMVELFRPTRYQVVRAEEHNLVCDGIHQMIAGEEPVFIALNLHDRWLEVCRRYGDRVDATFTRPGQSIGGSFEWVMCQLGDIQADLDRLRDEALDAPRGEEAR